MITAVYQPLGSSTHKIAQKLGAHLGEPTTHTGTLDPMAEGVVVCLSGEDRFNKQQHSAVKKEYSFTILVGCATDSHDLLGLPKVTNKSVDATNLQKSLQELTGTYEQVLPSFSAKRIDGKSLFDKAKQKEKIGQFKQQISVYSLSLNNVTKINNKELLAEIKKRISLVKGDFRQTEILSEWENQLQDTFSFQLVTCTAVPSKRTYIRGIVRDVSQKLHIPITTFHILRTKNGQYQVKDCICLV